MRNKKAEDIMTPIEDVFMVSYEAVLDFNILSEIFTRGFTRIPVYDGEKTNVVNVLNVKDIAFLDPDDKVPLKAILKTYAEPPSPVICLRDPALSTSISVSDPATLLLQTQAQLTTLEVILLFLFHFLSSPSSQLFCLEEVQKNTIISTSVFFLEIPAVLKTSVDEVRKCEFFKSELLMFTF